MAIVAGAAVLFHRHRPGHGDFGGLTGNFGDVFMVMVDGESVVGVMGGDASE